MESPPPTRSPLFSSPLLLFHWWGERFIRRSFSIHWCCGIPITFFIGFYYKMTIWKKCRIFCFLRWSGKKVKFLMIIGRISTRPRCLWPILSHQSSQYMIDLCVNSCLDGKVSTWIPKSSIIGIKMSRVIRRPVILNAKTRLISLFLCSFLRATSIRLWLNEY